ncbi:MAG: hypothetical protein KDK66_03705 [Deltaproteobacteria bacterium]|nr:hypothetical protein [Deltaproteobacteria bacterium]
MLVSKYPFLRGFKFFLLLLSIFVVASCGENNDSLNLNISPNPVCGNAQLETGESCDDGNTVTELCDYGQSSCTVCNDTCQEVAGTASFCGDGIVDTQHEACDDGGESANCNNDCTLVSCGDGKINTSAGEVCDDTNLDGQDCYDYDFSAGGNLACQGDCMAFNTNGCTNWFCSTPHSSIGPDADILTIDTLTAPIRPGYFITDLNVFIHATHSYLEDIVISLRHVESGTSMRLQDKDCGSLNDIMAIYDQEATDFPACNPSAQFGVEDTVLPLESLNLYVGMPSEAGDTWRLDILDTFDNDGGTLEAWCVEIELGTMEISECGDGVANFGEDCDGLDLGGKDCFSVNPNAVGGTLACDAFCQFDTSGCIP